MEKDEETYHSMTNLKKIMLTKYDWLLLPMLGFCYNVLHSAKRLLQRYCLTAIQAT